MHVKIRRAMNDTCHLNFFGPRQLGSQHSFEFRDHLVVRNASASFVPDDDIITK